MAPTIDCIDKELKEKLLYWAVIEHYRSWKHSDRIFLERLSKNNGNFDAPTVRDIAKEYSVIRGIPRKNNKEDKVAAWIADRLNKEAAKWPENLNERAHQCAEISTEAKEKYTKNEIFSAVTKLMWFLKPDGWTIFDNLTATALGARNKKHKSRMTVFYEELHKRKFVCYANKIGKIFDGSDLNELHGERVIDKFLMLSGAPVVWTMDIIDECKLFLNGCDVQQQLKEVADCISRKFAASLLNPANKDI